MSDHPEMTDGAAEPRGGTRTVTFRLNGETRTLEVNAGDTLLEVLRNRLGITSARGVCGIGVCGACTVLVDGKVTSSCIMLAAQAHGRDVTTGEGLRLPSGELSTVQRAFVNRGAYQCSFCIPGMVLTVHAALQDPEVGRDVDAVREYLAGNLCRCGTYPTILEAVADLVGATTAEPANGGTA